MKKETEPLIKANLIDLLEYINFQFEGLKTTLKQCKSRKTLACLSFTRTVFEEEMKDQVIKQRPPRQQ